MNLISHYRCYLQKQSSQKTNEKRWREKQGHVKQVERKKRFSGDVCAEHHSITMVDM